MTKILFIRFIVLLVFLGFCVYSYLDIQNGITELRIKIPELTTKVRQIQEENMRILYEIEMFESPENLMQLAQKSEYASLKFPICTDVLTMREAETFPRDTEMHMPKRKPQVVFATGVNQ